MRDLSTFDVPTLSLMFDLDLSYIASCRTDIDYNNANCAGQNGASNAAANGGPQYSGGILTTTGGGILSTTAATISTSLTSTFPAAVWVASHSLSSA